MLNKEVQYITNNGNFKFKKTLTNWFPNFWVWRGGGRGLLHVFIKGGGIEKLHRLTQGGGRGGAGGSKTVQKLTRIIWMAPYCQHLSKK